MIAVIFEVRPAEGHLQHYLNIASNLRPELQQLDGFLSVERFQSLGDPGKYLSLSYFRDDQAVARWRNSLDHRAAQSSGRSHVFVDYRLRIAAVLRDYGMSDRVQAPDDSRAHHG